MLHQAAEAARAVSALPEDLARATANLYSQIAPRSNIGVPGHVHMADSIKTEKLVSLGPNRAAWRIEVNKDYAIFSEYGTVNQEGTPAFRTTTAAMRRVQRDRMKHVKVLLTRTT